MKKLHEQARVDEGKQGRQHMLGRVGMGHGAGTRDGHCKQVQIES